MKTYYFDDGKYQVDRNDEGIMTDMRRGGEHWNAGYSSFQFSKLFHAMLNRIDERDARIAELEKPIPMVLHCPACGTQHIDAESPMATALRKAGVTITGSDELGLVWSDGERREHPWINPPHRSHLCHQCEHVWRPADVPTTGVAGITTVGKADKPIVQPVRPNLYGVLPAVDAAPVAKKPSVNIKSYVR